MGCHGKCAMAIDPTVGIGFAPGGLPIDASKSFGDYAFFFLLFVPDGAFGFVHHFISADGVVFTQVQEIAEK